MAGKSFYSEEARSRATELIKEIESRSSAEIVVALRKSSGFYRHADYLGGYILALIVLCVLLFHPMPFEILLFPIEVTVGFIAGAFITSRIPPIRRFLSGRKLMEENVVHRSHSVFHEMGVSRTSGRTGILLYISVFERACEVVPDIGVLAADPGPEFLALRDRMKIAVRNMDSEAFFEAMKALGPVLEFPLPRSEDDINELPDEVSAA